MLDGGFTKSGPGTLTLTATQTYSGPTVVSGGVLKLQGLPVLPVTAGLLYQLDASNAANLTLSGNNVTAWNDSSVNHNNFVVNNASPTYVTSGPDTINGKPGVQFDGTNSNQQLLLSTALSTGTVLYVTRTTNFTGLNTLWGPNDSDGGIRMATSTSWAASGDGNDFTNGNGGAIYINGANTSTFTAGDPYVFAAYRGTGYSHDNTGTLSAVFTVEDSTTVTSARSWHTARSSAPPTSRRSRPI